MEDEGRSAIGVATGVPIQVLPIANPQHPRRIGAHVGVETAHRRAGYGDHRRASTDLHAEQVIRVACCALQPRWTGPGGRWRFRPPRDPGRDHNESQPTGIQPRPLDGSLMRSDRPAPWEPTSGCEELRYTVGGGVGELKV